MYVLIDMDQLAITHKSQSRQFLNALSWIECKNAAKVLPLGDPSLFSKALTPYEMLKVYENATGHPLRAYGNVMATILHDMAKRLPDSEGNEAEAVAQMKCIMPADPKSYKYSPGSKTPEHVPNMFQRQAIKVSVDQAEIDNAPKAAAAYTAARQANPPPPPKPAPPELPALPGQAAARTPRVPGEPGALKRPKPGSTCGNIWEVFDKFVENNGREPNIQECFAQPELDGINHNTLRTQFSQWRRFNRD